MSYVDRSGIGNITWRSNDAAESWAEESVPETRTLCVTPLDTSRTNASTEELYFPSKSRSWRYRLKQLVKRRMKSPRSLYRIFGCTGPEEEGLTTMPQTRPAWNACGASHDASEQNTARSSVYGVVSQSRQSQSALSVSQTTEQDTFCTWSTLESRLVHTVKDELDRLKHEVSVLKSKLQDTESTLARAKNERDFYKLKCDRLRAKLEDNFKAMHNAAEAALHLQLPQGDHTVAMARVTPRQYQVPMNLQIRVPARHLDPVFHRIPAAMNSAKSIIASNEHSKTATQESFLECIASPATERQDHECDNYYLYVYHTYGIGPPSGYLIPSDYTLPTDRTALTNDVGSQADAQHNESPAAPYSQSPLAVQQHQVHNASPSASPSVSPSASHGVSPTVSPSASHGVSPSVSPSGSHGVSPSALHSAQHDESPSVQHDESCRGSPTSSDSSGCLSPVTSGLRQQFGVVETTHLLPLTSTVSGDGATFLTETYPYDMETGEDEVVGGTTRSVLVFPSATWTFTPLCASPQRDGARRTGGASGGPSAGPPATTNAGGQLHAVLYS